MEQLNNWWKNKRKWVNFLLLAGVLLYITSRLMLPAPKFSAPTSTVLEDSSGTLMGARIAADSQWRFPASDSVPRKFKQCILRFEDRYFYFHPGFNPASMLRALFRNIKAGKIEEGGSTITMQLARLLRNNRQRTIGQKFIEFWLALHLEINYSKEELLKMYVSHAPFGGNVVGLKAAAWRYYGRNPSQLSWAESAALAVLPNAPALIFPGKNQEALKQKRNRLLEQLHDAGVIDEQTLHLSKLETLPGKPLPLPQYATHLLDRAHRLQKGKKVITRVDPFLQRKTQELVNLYTRKYAFNEIHNAAALIIETETGNVLSYVGNATNSKEHGNYVNIIRAPRSTGSLLKPFLYASLLSHGELLPEMLVADIPTYISGYSPKNYYMTYDGAVPANEALFKSLNVPFVRLLQKHGVHRFYNELKQMGMHSLVFPSDHYGLSLILGGAEGKLDELVSMYAGMARRLIRYQQTGKLSGKDFFISKCFEKKVYLEKISKEILSPSAIYETFETLTELNRPVSRKGWKSFGSSRKIAWKTGTSFGNKDGWAIGVTPEYTVGIWVGNADGEGRSGLTGLNAAAPILFDLFDYLPETSWFQKPYNDYKIGRICRKSGHKAAVHCAKTDTVYIPKALPHTEACPYHLRIHLTPDEQYRVNRNCEPTGEIIHKSWFVLPPAQEWYFKRKAPLYKSMPPIRQDCREEEKSVMEFIYPKTPKRIYIPLELSGEKGRVVFELAHRASAKKVFWHLDGTYLGYTQTFHQMEILTGKGNHTLIVVDEDGNELVKVFEVLSD